MERGGQCERQQLVLAGKAWLQASLGESAEVEFRQYVMEHGGALLTLHYAVALPVREAIATACALEVLVPVIPGFRDGYVHVAQVSCPYFGNGSATILLRIVGWREGARQEAE